MQSDDPNPKAKETTSPKTEYREIQRNRSRGTTFTHPWEKDHLPGGPLTPLERAELEILNREHRYDVSAFALVAGVKMQTLLSYLSRNRAHFADPTYRPGERGKRIRTLTVSDIEKLANHFIRRATPNSERRFQAVKETFLKDT